MKRIAIVAALGSALIATGHAEARGCIKGAIVGGIAGHYAGHHAIMGAMAGCAIGHHYANKKVAPAGGATNTPDDPNAAPPPK